MKKIGMLLLICLLMIKSSFCQIGLNEYPKKMYVNGDTIVAISIQNLDSINTIILKLDECNRIGDINESLINEYVKREDNYWKPIIDEKNIQLSAKDTIISKKDEIIGIQNEQIAIKDNKIKWLKIKKIILIGTTILFIFI